MRNEVLQESLSALMDNEADELEVRRVLQAADQDPALRSTWARYQMARSVMHKEPWQGSIDLSAGIAAALQDFQPGLRGQRLRGRHHAAPGIDGAAAREVGIVVAAEVGEGGHGGLSFLVQGRILSGGLRITSGAASARAGSGGRPPYAWR